MVPNAGLQGNLRQLVFFSWEWKLRQRTTHYLPLSVIPSCVFQREWVLAPQYPMRPATHQLLVEWGDQYCLQYSSDWC
jgi:hypothetical protein